MSSFGAGSPNCFENVWRSASAGGLPKASTMTIVWPVPAGCPLTVSGMLYAARMLAGSWHATAPFVAARQSWGRSDGVILLAGRADFAFGGWTVKTMSLDEELEAAYPAPTGSRPVAMPTAVTASVATERVRRRTRTSRGMEGAGRMVRMDRSNSL